MKLILLLCNVVSIVDFRTVRFARLSKKGSLYPCLKSTQVSKFNFFFVNEAKTTENWCKFQLIEITEGHKQDRKSFFCKLTSFHSDDQRLEKTLGGHSVIGWVILEKLFLKDLNRTYEAFLAPKPLLSKVCENLMNIYIKKKIIVSTCGRFHYKIL